MTKLTLLVLLAGASKGITMGSILFCLVFMFASLALFVIWIEDQNKSKILHVLAIITLALGIIFGTVGMLIPTEKSLYIAAGVETAHEFTKTETAKELNNDGLSIIKDITSIIHSYAIEKSNKSSME